MPYRVLILFADADDVRTLQQSLGKVRNGPFDMESAPTLAKGLVMPERFVAISEECGLIVPIGRWVLGEACAQLARWTGIGISTVSIAVNISAPEFCHRDFFAHALAIFDATGVDRARVQLELTESVLMHDVAASARLLASFKAMGVQIAVDDFGTGYSSLSYLNEFPIDVLKIDQSFVRAIETGSGAGRNGAIVSAVIDMGKNSSSRYARRNRSRWSSSTMAKTPLSKRSLPTMCSTMCFNFSPCSPPGCTAAAVTETRS